MSVTAAPRRRDRHQPRRHDRPAPQPAPRRARTSRRWCAGCPRAPGCAQGAKLAIKHTTRWARALVKDLQYQLDVNTLHRYEDAVGLSLNEIGRVTLRTTLPLFYDEYRRNRTTGSFILVDEATNTTVGAGMILAPAERVSGEPNVTWHPGQVARADRPSQGATVWFTGLSGSGKSTVAAACEAQLVAAGRPAYVLDGDNIRHGLNGDLGFSAEDRAENVRRVGHVARLMADAGLVALVPLISPYRADRDAVRALHDGGRAAVRRGVRRHADRAVRAARPQGPLRQGPGRRAHGLHRHRRPLRGARAPRARAHARTTATPTPWRPSCSLASSDAATPTSRADHRRRSPRRSRAVHLALRTFGRGGLPPDDHRKGSTDDRPEHPRRGAPHVPQGLGRAGRRHRAHRLRDARPRTAARARPSRRSALATGRSAPAATTRPGRS